MMEIIESLVGQENGDFTLTVESFINSELSFKKVISFVDEMEEFFLKTKSARQIIHGVAYGKLQTNEEKKEYRERYKLNVNTVGIWADIVKTWGIKSRLGENFKKFECANALAKLDHKEAEKIVDQAIKKEKPAKWVSEKCIAKKQEIQLEKAAKHIKKIHKNITIEEAIKKAKEKDKEKRVKAFQKQKEKQYQKAKKIVTETEAKTSALVALDDLEWSLKIFGLKIEGMIINAKINLEVINCIYKMLSKKYHPDLKGGSDKKMSDLNKAREILTK